ncbi:hypothetical protein LP422_18840 [Janibacter limosus]|uniref:Uncharacterized protein n=1 Tax=Janibacter limosus TaxID=53458 RepID=A0AC61U392_9MICO|nr:hypothetical protein [Janibacter limosus]UUZ44438.1 hypothetical protein LP422_18840 [Janibacter limosus]
MGLKTIAASFVASAGLVLVAAAPAQAAVPDCALGSLPYSSFCEISDAAALTPAA